MSSAANAASIAARCASIPGARRCLSTAASSYSIASLKKNRALLHEITEPLRARPQQLEHGGEPGVSIAEIVVAPQPGRFEPGPHPRRELVGGEPQDVLLVEPVQLLGIEHRVAAADPLEREGADQRLAREHFSVVGPGDQPSSERKFTIASGR